MLGGAAEALVELGDIRPRLYVIEASTIVANFQDFLTAPGVSVHAPLETPEAIGRVERHGGILKVMIRRITGDIQASGITEISTVVTEACIAKNELHRHRHGSYSPSQWVLGKMPNTSPSVLSEQSWADLGAIGDQCDPRSLLWFMRRGQLPPEPMCISTVAKEFNWLCYAMQGLCQDSTKLGM